MAALDFLFEGTPPKAVTTYGQSVENMPKWYSDYTQGLVARANAIAAEPYQAYGGPRIAGFSPDQQASQSAVRGMQGAYQPFTSAANGFINSSAQVNPLSYASPYLSSASSLTKGGAGEDITGAAQPFINQAYDVTGQYQTAAQPYMQAAGQRFPDGTNVQDYMDPYIGNVIDRSTDLAMRNFNEKVMPGIEGQFVRNGTYGSSAHEREANRAARDLTEGIQGQAGAALSGAYQNAAQNFNADASRQGNLAQLAQSGALQAGAQYGNLAQLSGNLSNMEAQNQLTAGNQMGQLGQTAGQLSDMYADNRLAAGQQMGNLGQLMQQLGYRDAAGLETIGQQQQALGQSNLDLAYQDFLNQKNYPRDTVDWMNSVIRGLTPPKTTQTTQQTAGTPGPSPLSQIATLGSVIKGWGEMNNNGG